MRLTGFGLILRCQECEREGNIAQPSASLANLCPFCGSVGPVYVMRSLDQELAELAEMEAAESDMMLHTA